MTTLSNRMGRARSRAPFLLGAAALALGLVPCRADSPAPTQPPPAQQPPAPPASPEQRAKAVEQLGNVVKEMQQRRAEAAKKAADASEKAKAERAAAPKQAAPAPEAHDESMPEPTGGRLEVPHVVFDGGTVDRGALVEHTFELRNVGTGDLVVDAKASCGCTLVDFDKRIAPGQSGKVTATLKTRKFRGDVSKGVTVETNDPDQPSVYLEIKAHVVVPVDLHPETVSMRGKVGDVEPGKVTVTSDEPFDVVAVRMKNPAWFKLTVEPVVAPVDGKPVRPPKPKPGLAASGATTYEVTIEATKALPLGLTKEMLTIETTHPRAPVVEAQVFPVIRGNVQVSPEKVGLRIQKDPAAGKRVAHVVIRKTEPQGPPLKVISVTSSSPSLKTELKTTTEGQEYDLEVRYEGDVPRGALNEKITVKTNDRLQASIDILVSCLPEAADPPSRLGGQ